MYIEERTYVLHTDANLQEYLEAYSQIGLPLQKKILGGFIGYFITEVGTLNQLTHLWAYESLDDRDARRAALAKEPEWQRCMKTIKPMIKSMENKIMKPAEFSPIRSLPISSDEPDTAFSWTPNP